MKKLLPIILCLAIILLAQGCSSEMQETLDQNRRLVEQFAQLAPMGINPYITIFLTSLCSVIGFHNDFVAINPFFNNWFVLVLFGILFLFTALVGTVFKTNKATAPIGLADDYLSNHAALIINGFVMVAPVLLSDNPIHNEIVYQAGFISVSLNIVLILFASTYFLFVVTTVRFFVDTLIFLSPVPLIDSILAIFKIVLTIGFVIISIVSPATSVMISGLMFLTAIFFYRRANRMISKSKYLIVYPILNAFKKKKSILKNGQSLSILVYVNMKTAKFKKGEIVRIEQRNDTFFLVKRRFLFSKVEEEISLENCFLSQNNLDIVLSNDAENLSLILNRSYHKFLDELAEIMNAEIRKRAELKLTFKKGILNRIRNMFDRKDIAELKSMAK